MDAHIVPAGGLGGEGEGWPVEQVLREFPRQPVGVGVRRVAGQRQLGQEHGSGPLVRCPGNPVVEFGPQRRRVRLPAVLDHPHPQRGPGLVRHGGGR